MLRMSARSADFVQCMGSSDKNLLRCAAPIWAGAATDQCAVQPPSIGNTAPVMDAASSEARNNARAATCGTVTNSRVGSVRVRARLQFLGLPGPGMMPGCGWSAAVEVRRV
jgi:hypothetical protein